MKSLKPICPSNANIETKVINVRPLSANNIEAELSYAYLHAVASKAGVGCKLGSRHDDNAGIDAELTGWGPFPNGGYLTEIDNMF